MKKLFSVNPKIFIKERRNNQWLVRKNIESSGTQMKTSDWSIQLSPTNEKLRHNGEGFWLVNTNISNQWEATAQKPSILIDPYS